MLREGSRTLLWKGRNLLQSSVTRTTVPRYFVSRRNMTLSEQHIEIQNNVEKIFDLLKAAEHQDYIGEAISQQQHALQAAQLAREAGHENDVILAALLHDIGHLCAQPGAEMMGNAGVKGHENIGAAYLRRRGFSEKVAQLVEAHVLVKRYLTARYPEYLDKLSDASKLTLKYQGGPLSAEEAAKFEKDPLFDLKCKMRSWDEAAKRTDWVVPALETYRPIMISHLESQQK